MNDIVKEYIDNLDIDDLKNSNIKDFEEYVENELQEFTKELKEEFINYAEIRLRESKEYASKKLQEKLEEEISDSWEKFVLDEIDVVTILYNMINKYSNGK